MFGPLEIIIIIALPILIVISLASRAEKEYKVFKHHTDGYKAVKVGLAWVAGTIFMPIWFLFRGLWSYFFLYLVLLVIAVLVENELYGEFGSIDFNNASDTEWIWLGIQIIVAFIPLFKGNDWTAKNLIKKGYLFQDSVHAVSKKNAIAIVLENKIDSSYNKNDTQIRPSKRMIRKKVVVKSKSSKKLKRNDKAAKEFVMQTIRDLDYVVIRESLNIYIKSEENAKNLYAFLYGLALFTWSIHKVKLKYEDFETVFDIVDSGLNDSGIDIPRHLDLDEDYDEISSGFVDIYTESIGWDKINSEEDLINSVNKDFQSIGIYYARAYSRDENDLKKLYFVKLVNTISENT